MKKLKILAAMLALCLVFVAGCGKNSNLKLTSTNLSAADFYYNVVAGTKHDYLSGDIEGKVSLTKSQKKYFPLFCTSIYDSEEYAICIVSAMDYCMQILQNNSGDAFKAYEYNNIGIKDKAFVIVNKNKGENIFRVKFYEMASGSTLTDAMEEDPSVSYNFEISLDKANEKYNFKEKLSNSTGWFWYNPNKSTLKMSFTYKTLLNIVQQVDIYAYGYTNNIYSGRIVTNQNYEGRNLSVVCEFLNVPFCISLKIGLIKKLDEYVNLEKTTVDKIAVTNAGDAFGFTLVSDSRTGQVNDDNQEFEVVPVFKGYGIFPSE